jgi:hypothetical protein
MVSTAAGLAADQQRFDDFETDGRICSSPLGENEASDRLLVSGEVVRAPRLRPAGLSLVTRQSGRAQRRI